MGNNIHAHPLRRHGNGNRGRQAIALLLMSLIAAALMVAVSPPASAQSSPSTTPIAAVEVQKSVSAEPQATCNYMALTAVNLHRDKDRSSTIIESYPKGHVFTGAFCDEEEGGKYGSCGTGNTWNYWERGWLASKCLVRV